MKRIVLFLFVLWASPAWATNYYISPTGSNSNNGLSSGAPFLTFTYALDPTRASCGHTLNLLNGVYGDGTSTGSINLAGRVCTAGNELTIKAVNSRQARIHNNGVGNAIGLVNFTPNGSAYIIFDGIVANSTNVNNYCGACPNDGMPFIAKNANHLTIKNSLFYNPNKFNNTHPISLELVTDTLVEDTELYEYHRHAIGFFSSQRNTARRVYGNPRAGRISGGFSSSNGPVPQGAIGTAATLVSFYPCTNCILENGIMEGNGDLIEMNASFYDGVLMQGTKVLGSIASGSTQVALYPNSRITTGSQYSPTNITFDHIAVVNSTGACMRNQDPVNVTVNHLTCLSPGGGTDHAINIFDQAGVGASALSTTITNSVVKGWGNVGFLTQPSGALTWSGSNNFSNSNGVNYDPTLPSNWSTPTASVQTDPGMGTCYAWPPDGSAATIAGAGARILYRYQGGILTSTQLWNQTTGEFPHGATVVGINDTATTSLYNVHTRLNINAGGCNFPSGYVVSGGDSAPPTAPSNLAVSSLALKRINLSWTLSTDDTAVTNYFVESCAGAGCANFAQVAATTGLTYADTGLLVSQSYSYRVRATDAANNLSNYSATATATVPPVAYHPTLNLRRVSLDDFLAKGAVWFTSSSY